MYMVSSESGLLFLSVTLNNPPAALMQHDFQLAPGMWNTSCSWTVGIKASSNIRVEGRVLGCLSFRGFVEMVSLGCPYYLGALIILVIKPSGNTCMKWIIHQQLRGHTARFISLSELANLSKESADVRETSQPIWIKAPTRKWEVQGQGEVGVMSLLSS